MKAGRQPRDTVAEAFDARVSLAEVTHGVSPHGAAPEMKRESSVALVLLLMAPVATVPSTGFL
jgi:hypothetical protein